MYARNTYDGEVIADSDAGGGYDTISFSNNVPSGYSVNWKVCIKQNGAEIHCSGWDLWFDE